MSDLWVMAAVSDAEQFPYRWRHCESGEQGMCALPELAARWPEATVTLLVSGIDCPSRRMAFKPEEKSHLARLLPYQLETELAQDIGGLHIALGAAASAGKSDDVENSPDVILSYIDRRTLSVQITALESAGFDVRHCYAEPLLLPATEACWIFRLVGEQVDISWGHGCAASVDAAMLPTFLAALQHGAAAAPQSLRLQGLTDADLERLGALVTASAWMQGTRPEMRSERLQCAWDGIEGAGSPAARVSASIPDLRQGAFVRPLRWRKYWRPARVPLLAAVLAAVAFAVVSVIETQLNNQRFRNLQQEIESVYREAVPAGVLVDAEQQLRAQLGQLGSGSRGASVLAMLNKITPQLSQNTQISINRLSFNGANTAGSQSELQLSIEAASNTDILQFSEQLNGSGLQARAQNMTQAGSRQQASMIITEVAP
ncbi:MAG: type II secretion system protein GspL [Pseudohongiella sp.]|uniref:type II secretion system protein GspL n=1 Tax=Pseudohongiella sp. TaxID=1979412 RepID=UPI0034A02CBE